MKKKREFTKIIKMVRKWSERPPPDVHAPLRLRKRRQKKERKEVMIVKKSRRRISLLFPMSLPHSKALAAISPLGCLRLEKVEKRG